MKSKLELVLILFLILGIYTSPSYAENPAHYLVQAFHENCKHGLHSQPNDGPFSIFLFCDDALGSNIGIILTEPGAGPGKLPRTGTKTWDQWYTYNRFWQDEKWATDIVNFVWGPSFRFLYVATSGTYGDGGLFKLDLKKRTFERILPRKSGQNMEKLKSGYLTRIEQFDTKLNILTVGVYRYGTELELIATEQLPIE